MIEQDHRPKLHFTPPFGWINDPNGMVHIEGNYHLFYQYFPDGLTWGPMHWGHAVSRDFIEWKHLPTALYPDELGMIFSGSCVYDVNNTSEFGKDGHKPIAAIFTNHHEVSGTEVQSIAYSLDGIHFEKYYGNPVITEPSLKDFRDPKAFWNPINNCWSLVLAANDRVKFYRSDNLKLWSKTGDFVVGGNGVFGICECPDCFPVKTECGIKWVLIISMIIPVDDERKQVHKTQYFIGQFDGDTFVDTERSDDPLWLNCGPDHYAGVTFQNLDKPVMIGWANNWKYACDTPATDYRGQMTLATEIKLKNTALGWRVAMTPLGLEAYKTKELYVNSGVKFKSNAFGVNVRGADNEKIIFSNEEGEEICIEVTNSEIIVDRTKSGKKVFHPLYDFYGKTIAKRFSYKDFELKIIFDVSLLEIFADDGLISITMSVYPDNPYSTLKFDGDSKVELYYFN
ncbi:MAG: glycoside hydrolase family 32 protein [Clostridiales bacterium]|jgi:fructan beta-fructosidase|nr:glycoside hydrolase family 32 protein [Clostridiales bacterium]